MKHCRLLDYLPFILVVRGLLRHISFRNTQRLVRSPAVTCSNYFFLMINRLVFSVPSSKFQPVTAKQTSACFFLINVTSTFPRFIFHKKITSSWGAFSFGMSLYNSGLKEDCNRVTRSARMAIKLQLFLVQVQKWLYPTTCTYF